jgi:ribosomal 50S subunit-recycling heat shock protein
MATETRTRSRSSISGRPVKKDVTGRRSSSTVTTGDKIKTTSKKKPTVRVTAATTTRRGNSVRTSRR